MRSLNGGYVMVDLKGADFAGIADGVTINGIFKVLTNALGTGKPILAYNFTNGVNISPIEMAVTYDSENEVFGVKLGALEMEVGADDTFRSGD